ncbi:putative 26S proteasome regulatory subunit Rpn10 [Giardia muris]|uniref:Putative 26S proteasome regulatory subunit Rpn10 n=1 Tax=Giardia muris TaxID=5742 RepID=A0A4Z1T4G0_GIAMU|nr:putative 26S proteasome regulatory subunit Rpn10 [Giardia muris]|eukprot:TNJ30558.1 putative 26S proteasome regulatory subunit Rpn10 [Giardia muris]
MVTATAVVVDTSAYTINGEYSPTVISQIIEMARTYVDFRTTKDSEALLALISLGREPSLIAPLTNDRALMMATLSQTVAESILPIQKISFGSSFQLALLALQQCSNKSLQQEIVLLLYGDLRDTIPSADLRAQGTFLAANQIDLTIYLFGKYTETNRAFLEPLTTEAQRGAKVLIQTVTTKFLAEYMSSSLYSRDIGVDQIYYDDDENDPELQLALELSRQEMLAMQAAQQKNDKTTEESAPHIHPSETDIFGMHHPNTSSSDTAKEADEKEKKELAKELGELNRDEPEK